MTETSVKAPKAAAKKAAKKRGKPRLNAGKGSPGRPSGDGPGAPRKPKKVEFNIVRGNDLARVEACVVARSAEGFLPKQIVSGHYNGDAGWLIIFE